MKERISNLDGLKGLFIIFIVLFHVNSAFDSPLKYFLGFFYTYGGFFGNAMFFMISGFLISYTFKEKIIRQELSGGEFIIRRLKKIYPLYFISNLFALVIEFLGHGFENIDLKRIVLSFLMISKGWIDDIWPYNGPTWFICVIFLCYILFYIICSRISLNNYVMSLICMIFFGYFIESHSINFPFCYSYVGEGYVNFFLGCLLVELVQKFPANSLKIAQKTGIILIFLTIVLSCRVGFETFSGDVRVAFSFVICPIIILTCVSEKIYNGFLRTKPFIYLGKISMSIFYWHYPLLTVFIKMIELLNLKSLNSGILFVMYLTVVIIVAMISYHVLERKWVPRIISNGPIH